MFCNECGAEIVAGDAFCGICGARVPQPSAANPENQALVEPSNDAPPWNAVAPTENNAPNGFAPPGPDAYPIPGTPAPTWDPATAASSPPTGAPLPPQYPPQYPPQQAWNPATAVPSPPTGAPLPPQYPPQPTEKKKSKLVPIIIIAAAVVVLLVAAIAFILIAKPFDSTPTPVNQVPLEFAPAPDSTPSQTPDPTPTPQSSSSDDYLLPDSDKRLIKTSDIENFTNDQLWYARCEILARHGKVFFSEELNGYFEAQDWYKPVGTPETVGFSDLSDIELENVRFIQAREKALGSTIELWELPQR